MTRESTRILVVDDEPAIRELVQTVLRYEGFTVTGADCGRAALAQVEEFRPHLIVLDVMMPDLDGFVVQQRLADAGHQIPVIFLTAKDAVEDRVRGLTMGADDFIMKPFSVEEFVARVRVALRRSGDVHDDSTIVLDDLELDEMSYEVRRGGAIIDLTPTEFKLLRYLMRNQRRVLTKAQILDHVWQYDFNGDTSIVETYVSYLRRKLDDGAPTLIRTVRGIGYTMRPLAR